jgi:ParB family chromosome partitioning protein
MKKLIRKRVSAKTAGTKGDKPKTEKPVSLKISSLVQHPQNPRITLRENVVERIADLLKRTGWFDPAHALIVRKLGKGRYQIIAGHHRAEAAKRAGLETIPCWVRKMSDEAAYLALVTLLP